MRRIVAAGTVDVRVLASKVEALLDDPDLPESARQWAARAREELAEDPGQAQVSYGVARRVWRTA